MHALTPHVRRAASPARALMAVAALGLAACSDNIEITGTQTEVPAAEVQTVAPPLLSSVRASEPVIQPCSPAVSYHLTDGRRVIGTVKVMNDSKKLYVTYTVTSKHWWISDTRLAVAKTYAAIPQDNNRSPLPWEFPHKGIHTPVVTSLTHEMTLAELNVRGGDKIVVAAMAGVVHPKNDSNYEGSWEWMVMWGIGNITGKSYETVHNYTVGQCAGQPVEHPPALAGRITITFDDGFATTFTNAYPVLKDLGLVANVAINAEPIDGGWSDYLTLAQLKQLSAAGWGMVSHSVTHRDLTTLTDAQLEYELKESRAWLTRNGFPDSDVFIVPFHSWGERERAAVKRHYARARGYTVNQFWPAKFVKMPFAEPYDLTGFEPEFAPFTTAEGRAQTLTHVERAVAQGEFVDLFFHRLPADQIPAFRALMTEVAKYKTSVTRW